MKRNARRQYGARKRGISEVVTAILLTALAVAGGAFVTIWYRQNAEKQTGVFEQYATEEECSSVMFEVSFSAEQCKAMVYNTGLVKIDSIKVGYFYLDGKRSSETLVGMLPKGAIEIPSEKLNSLLEKLQVTPILEKDGKGYACANERIFPPTEEFVNKCI